MIWNPDPTYRRKVADRLRADTYRIVRSHGDRGRAIGVTYALPQGRWFAYVNDTGCGNNAAKSEKDAIARVHRFALAARLTLGAVRR